MVFSATCWNWSLNSCCTPTSAGGFLCSHLQTPHCGEDGTAIWIGHHATESNGLEFSWVLKPPPLLKLRDQYRTKLYPHFYLWVALLSKCTCRTCCITENCKTLRRNPQKASFLTHLWVDRGLATDVGRAWLGLVPTWGLSLELLCMPFIFPGPALIWGIFLPWQKAEAQEHKTNLTSVVHTSAHITFANLPFSQNKSIG